MKKLPHCTKPCGQCPFRSDSMEGWLGGDRMEEILAQDSFMCHKAPNQLQCAGHMIIKGEENAFVRLAAKLNITLDLSGHELVFDNEKDLVLQHCY